MTTPTVDGRPLDPPPPPGEEAAAEARRSFEDIWAPLNQRKWIEEPPPPRKYLISGIVDDKKAGILPLGKVALFAGAGGGGKSMSAIQLALCVATARAWFGFEVETPGRVVIALGEEDEEEAWRRIYFTSKAMGLEAEVKAASARIFPLPLAGHDVALTMAMPPGSPGLPVTPVFGAFYGKLKDEGEHGGWSLIVLDPLSRFAGPDVEKDNSVATRFVQVLERFTALPGTPTVLVTHHTSKLARRGGNGAKDTDAGAATDARGVSGLTDGVRWQAILEAEPRADGAPELVKMRVVKSNYGRFPPETFLVRDPDAHGALRTATQAEYEAHGAARGEVQNAAEFKKKKDKSAAIRKHILDALRGAREPLSAAKIRDQAAANKGKVDDLLKILEEEKLVERVLDGDRKAGWRLVQPKPSGVGPSRTESDWFDRSGSRTESD